MSILVNRLHLINKLVEDHFEQIFYHLWVIMVIAGICVFASPRPWNWLYRTQTPSLGSYGMIGVLSYNTTFCDISTAVLRLIGAYTTLIG